MAKRIVAGSKSDFRNQFVKTKAKHKILSERARGREGEGTVGIADERDDDKESEHGEADCDEEAEMKLGGVDPQFRHGG